MGDTVKGVRRRGTTRRTSMIADKTVSWHAIYLVSPWRRCCKGADERNVAKTKEGNACNFCSVRIRGLRTRSLMQIRSMDGFLRASVVVNKRVMCHPTEDDRMQLDDLNEDCWSHVQRYLVTDDFRRGALQFCAGQAALLVATSSTVFDVSPVADRHAEVSACVRADCSVLLSEQSHGSFVRMPATFFDDIIHDSVLLKTPTDVTSVVKDIKAPPQLHRFSGEGDSSTSTMLNRCLFLVQLLRAASVAAADPVGSVVLGGDRHSAGHGDVQNSRKLRQRDQRRGKLEKTFICNMSDSAVVR
ncbi:hypothetical protein HPB51_001378 [Rhipicephalus microplus]|uniref:Uncharacterized protein n=1 Tax=Rhipicephalus microplus TaxID=6941 RepID=A0A9J6EEB4_RHIMP|nr:hypothetical protein HPB51_001378 [Rhipicephalus microplus]